ncbi:hypothetical protein TELCIR_17490 [Teladorsagia circumcincta]|uniref:Uncharacterized protein n=1 Tax=Teladorsagia circumcincta TaxID=45464 RepID=A0A2G9TSM2_TELCI|nr:hypothetical protein TELCIR_17490 [Teladorsagia circumcincta]
MKGIAITPYMSPTSAINCLMQARVNVWLDYYAELLKHVIVVNPPTFLALAWKEDGSLWKANGIELAPETRSVRAGDEMSIEFHPEKKQKMIYQFTSNAEVQIWFQQDDVDLTPRFKMMTPKLAEEEILVLPCDSPVIFRVCNRGKIFAAKVTIAVAFL